MRPPESKVAPEIYAVLSGILLFLSYPPFYLGFFAWFALIPLLIIIPAAPSRGKAFLLGVIAGLVFFVISLEWFRYVTGIGWMLASGVESLFTGLFALLVYEIPSRGSFAGRWKLIDIIQMGLAWVACEFLRAKLPILGFAWNLLGDSQAHSLNIVQTANVFGSYGLSFVIVLVNCFIVSLFKKRRESEKKKKNFGVLLAENPLTYLAVIFTLIFSHGYYHQRWAGEKTGDLKISLIQGNIPQSVKWELVAREKILEIYSTLTELAGYDDPSLIIWPEAAFPGYFDHDLAAEDIKALVRKLGVPTLVGTTLLETESIAYNSAVLVGPDGAQKGRYDKLYLVPFGEYLPLKWAFPWFTPYAESLGISDFTAGKEKTVFHILNEDMAFSTLICFEDTFPELAHAFVEKGAQFLAVITNDAWFGKSAAAAQHVQASIMRAVENGVPVVRAANTGISSFISNRGEILGQVHDDKGETLFVTGRKTMALPIDKKNTIFRGGGWIFPYCASGVFLIIFLLSKLKGKSKKEKNEE